MFEDSSSSSSSSFAILHSNNIKDSKADWQSNGCCRLLVRCLPASLCMRRSAISLGV